MFSQFEHLNFDIVSSFDIRYSDLNNLWKKTKKQFSNSLQL